MRLTLPVPEERSLCHTKSHHRARFLSDKPFKLLKYLDTHSCESLSRTGYKVMRQGYTVDNQTYYNLEVEIPGTQRADEIVIVQGIQFAIP